MIRHKKSFGSVSEVGTVAGVCDGKVGVVSWEIAWLLSSVQRQSISPMTRYLGGALISFDGLLGITAVLILSQAASLAEIASRALYPVTKAFRN